MTEQKTPSATVETTHTDADNSTQKIHKSMHQSQGTSGRMLSLVAIALILALGAGLYYHGHQQSIAQHATTEALQQQLRQLQQSQAQEKQTLIHLQQTQEEADQRLAKQTKQLAELQERIAGISGNDTKHWLLAQADFMVKLAGRKLWNEQDVISAGALLKSADASLADMNDPSLLEARRLLTEDIGTLSSIKHVDFDGIILQLNQLANQVDNLRLTMQNSHGDPMDENNSQEISGTLSEWRQNISKSWHHFMSEFITIRRRDNNAEPLLAPGQDVYLRENIRSRLLIAAQAVPRHQNEIYKLSLETIAPWIRTYFDTEDQATTAFLQQLDDLSQQSINLDVPLHLKSQPILEQLIQKRVRNLLAQPSVDHQEG